MAVAKATAGLGKIFFGGKYHWRTILTGLGLYTLLKPKPRTDAAYQQLARNQQSGK